MKVYNAHLLTKQKKKIFLIIGIIVGYDKKS